MRLPGKRKNAVDLTGQKHNKLTVLKFDCLRSCKGLRS